MDIARPDVKRRKQRRRVLLSIGGVSLIALITLGLSRLEPAAPKVDRATIWSGIVERGEMLRQVRGNGTLVPERIVFVQAETEGRVERILVLPGAPVEPDTLLIQLSNAVLEQEVFDLQWQVKAAHAQLTNLMVKLKSDRFTQEAAVANTQSDLIQARLEAEADETLAEAQLIDQITAKRSRARVSSLEVSFELEQKRLEIAEESKQAQLAVQQADIAKLKASLELKRRQVDALNVRAGIQGVLQQIGDQQQLQVGQRIGPSSTLAKIVQPTKLKAEIKIAETQAKDVQIGQFAEIDTRNGIIPGRVSRVDPAVLNGTVTVDVKLDGALPKGARPDLSVDGTIELERLEDVLYVSRPVHGQAESTIGLFKITENGRTAARVQVQLGRSSVSTVEVIEGLEIGEEVILSDMSQWEEYDRLRLN